MLFRSYFPEEALKVRVLARLLYSQNCLNYVVSNFNGTTPLCQLCDKNAKESVCHMLFDCESEVYAVRDALWHNILQSAPEALRAEIQRLCSEQKTVFILSCFRSDYIIEWSDIYSAVLQFCYLVYKQRHDILLIDV